jgi:hypothetical protein
MRDPYPHYEPLAFDPIDGDLSSARALTRGLLLAGVLVLLTACLWI